DLGRLQAVERTDGKVLVGQFRLEQLPHVQYVLVELLGQVVLLHVQRNLLVGEEHEMLDKNLSRLFQSILRVDGTVRGNLKVEFLIVGFLLHTVVFHGILRVLDGRVYRVDGQNAEFGIRLAVFVCRHVPPTFVGGEFHLQLGLRSKMADDQIGIEHLEVRHEIRDVARRQFALSRDIDGHSFRVHIFHRPDKPHLLEIEDNVDDTLHHARNGGELVVDSGNPYVRYRVTLQRGQQDTAQGISDCHTESRLQRTELEFSELRSG